LIYLKKKFPEKKIVAVGCSLGANRLACYLGEEDCLVDAAACMQAPMKLWIACEQAKKTLRGFYDKNLGQSMAELYL
jgi:predicted alpha/beta-fold hydrolase